MKNVARALSNPDGLEVVGIMFVVGKNGLDFEPLQVRVKRNNNLIFSNLTRPRGISSNLIKSY